MSVNGGRRLLRCCPARRGRRTRWVGYCNPGSKLNMCTRPSLLPTPSAPEPPAPPKVDACTVTAAFFAGVDKGAAAADAANAPTRGSAAAAEGASHVLVCSKSPRGRLARMLLGRRLMTSLSAAELTVKCGSASRCCRPLPGFLGCRTRLKRNDGLSIAVATSVEPASKKSCDVAFKHAATQQHECRVS